MVTFFSLLLLGLVFKGASAVSMPKNDVMLNALTFISDLRVSSSVCENYGVQLPNFSLYPSASTLNKVVRSVVEKEYIQFWRDLRRRDHVLDMNQLVELFRGAAYELVDTKMNVPNLDKFRGHSEAPLLQPIFFANANLKASYCACMLKQEGNVLECLEREVMANEECKGVEREMILSSMWMLRVALRVSITGWYCLHKHLDDLRSEKNALKCIRNWDYIAVIPQILYLTFRLHARQVISHLSKDSKEAESVLELQMDLKETIQTELASIEMEKIEVNGALTYYENLKAEIFTIREIYFFSVNRAKESGKRAFLFLDDDHMLFCSIGDFIQKKIQKHTIAW